MLAIKYKTRGKQDFYTIIKRRYVNTGVYQNMSFYGRRNGISCPSKSQANWHAKSTFHY